MDETCARPAEAGGDAAEYAQGSTQPGLSHYERWAKHRAPGRDPAQFLSARRSIHVHFYTLSNVSALLQLAVDQAGYRCFEVIHAPNHKDFHLVITK
jgi:hypothetical protein